MPYRDRHLHLHFFFRLGIPAGYCTDFPPVSGFPFLHHTFRVQTARRRVRISASTLPTLRGRGCVPAGGGRLEFDAAELASLVIDVRGVGEGRAI